MFYLHDHILHGVLMFVLYQQGNCRPSCHYIVLQLYFIKDFQILHNFLCFCLLKTTYCSLLTSTFIYYLLTLIGELLHSFKYECNWQTFHCCNWNADIVICNKYFDLSACWMHLFSSYTGITEPGVNHVACY